MLTMPFKTYAEAQDAYLFYSKAGYDCVEPWQDDYDEAGIEGEWYIWF